MRDRHSRAPRTHHRTILILTRNTSGALLADRQCRRIGPRCTSANTSPSTAAPGTRGCRPSSHTRVYAKADKPPSAAGEVVCMSRGRVHVKRNGRNASQWTGAGTPGSLRDGCPHGAAILRRHLIEVQVNAIFQHSPSGAPFMHRNRGEAGVSFDKHGECPTWVIPDPLRLAVLDLPQPWASSAFSHALA